MREYFSFSNYIKKAKNAEPDTVYKYSLKHSQKTSLNLIKVHVSVYLVIIMSLSNSRGHY